MTQSLLNKMVCIIPARWVRLSTDYIYLFQLAGLILLVAMVGAITLTLRRRAGVRRQVIADQNSRTREETVRLAKVRSGDGAEETVQ